MDGFKPSNDEDDIIQRLDTEEYMYSFGLHNPSSSVG